MRTSRLLAAIVLSISTLSVYAIDPKFARQNVLNFLHRAPITVHLRITGTSVDEEIHDLGDGHVGYKRFKVQGTVIEAFKGAKPGKIEFYVTQEQPSDPPSSGEYIVSLDRADSGALYFADESVLWVAATPELLRAARAGK